MKSKSSPIVKNYSLALLQASKKVNSLSAINSQVLILNEVLDGDLIKTINNPLISFEKRKSIIEFLLIQINAHEILSRFLNIVMTNNRTPLLLNIIKDFLDCAAYDMGIVKATMKTSKPIDNPDEIEKNLSLRLSQKVSLTFEVDESLIAGCILYARNIIIDASLRTKLIKLKETLSHGV